MSRVEAFCPHCELIFDVPASMKGGIANCPECRRTVEIRGGPEPIYWILVGCGVLAVLGVSGLIALVSPLAGAVTAVVGLAVVAILAVAV